MRLVSPTGLLLNYGGRMQTILAVTCVVFCVCANGIHWLRGYFRWIDECCSQLKNFSMEKAHSHCCKSNHLNEAGSQIMCDREIITECIRLWFGSEEAFESCVRSEVSSLLIKGVLDLLSVISGFASAFLLLAPNVILYSYSLE